MRSRKFGGDRIFMKYRRNNQRTNLVSIIDGSSGDDEWVAKRGCLIRFQILDATACNTPNSPVTFIES